MTKDLLLELGVEEIPSAYMARALEQMEELAVKKFGEARLVYSSMKCYGTPRRLTLFVAGLEERQQDALLEARGPKKAAAIDADGNPTKAGLGFARGQGVDFKDLQIREMDGQEYLFAVRRETGKAAGEVLGEVLTAIIQGLVFPKSMRWGYYHTRFARPVRSLLALFGEEVIPLQVENLSSSRSTFGHRFLSREGLEVANPEEYFRVLKENYVILDQEERQTMIWEQVVATARAAGGTPMNNPELLEEINYLLEYPTAFYGEFSPSYLDVPPEVLTTTMIEHQRYFPVYDKQGQLMPGFIGIRNGTDYCLDNVIKGNQRVIKARLEDALFFWREDTRKALHELTPGLENVLFHERLGSVLDKVKRLQRLALFISRTTGLSSEMLADRTAYLCKADLLSNMVYEFPELQGIMGRYYAYHSEEETEVCEAIYEHYLPRFAGDQLPQTGTGIVLSLAEKADNLVGCFALNIKPTGSQDPYALRRQGIGIVNIVLDAGLEVNLMDVFGAAYDNLDGLVLEKKREETGQDVLEFILQRLRGVLLEKGFSYDVIDAVLVLKLPDLYDSFRRVEVLQAAKSSEELADFMVVFNRSNNLSKKWQETSVDPTILEDESEKKLYQELLEVEKDAGTAVAGRNYTLALSHLAGLRPVLDAFFEAVMVMVEDEALKAARLGILKRIANLGSQIADFSKIVV